MTSFDDERRRVQADFAGDEIHLLVVFQLQIDDAVLAEAVHRLAGLRVERDHLVAGRDVDDALLAVPSVQYDRPRPESCRGAASPRLPSFMLCIHSISPVAASSATAARRVPPAVYSTPLTISGVAWRLNSGRGPSASVLKRHATSSLLKLSALI